MGAGICSCEGKYLHNSKEVGGGGVGEERRDLCSRKRTEWSRGSPGISPLHSLLQALICISNAVEIKASPSYRRLRVTDSPVCFRVVPAFGCPEISPSKLTMPHKIASASYCCRQAPVPFEEGGGKEECFCLSLTSSVTMGE